MTAALRKAIYTREDEESLALDGHVWNFHDEGTGEHLHSLHPYPAKFIPQIPRRAIKLWTRRRDLVYDPFCGCGTTVLEASLAGRRGIGTDNNAVADIVTRAKTAIYSKSNLRELNSFASKIADGLSSAPPRPELIPANKNFFYWFEPDTIRQLAALKGLVLAEKEPVRTLLMAVLSSIVVKVSYQDSDTRYARNLSKAGVGKVASSFRSRLVETICRIRDTIGDGREPARFVRADARSVPFIKSGSISLIVTSPPYLNAYDYHKYHRQRLHWLGGEESVKFARDLEIGSHDEFTRDNASPGSYFDDMDACFSEWRRILKRGGRCLIVVGDAIVSKQPVRVADQFIDLLSEKGLAEERRWIRTLHSTKRAFNLKNNRISHEHVLLVVKR